MKKLIACLIIAVIFATTIGLFCFMPLKAASDGIVRAKGTSFYLDGQPYKFSGANCYYINFKSKQMVDNVIEDAAAMNLKVIRTWGFIDAGTQQCEGTFYNNADKEGSKDGVYFQYFDPQSKTPKYNTGDNGLKVLDYAIYKASKKNIKIILALTNNWEYFGGMPQYIKWLNIQNKDEFYTNKTLIGYYQNYVEFLLNRENVYSKIQYKDDPAIFAWELANEPRCPSDRTGNTLVEWADKMSSFIKKIDNNHMVCVGDEGFLNYSYEDSQKYQTNNHWAYHGTEGVDWERLISLKNIDFGTIHLYPEHWGTDVDWGVKWIKDHAKISKSINKPMIVEEFGLLDRSRRDNAYSKWLSTIENENIAGDCLWMLASYQNDGSKYPDHDGFTVYLDADRETRSTALLIKEHAQNMAQKK